MCGPMGVRRNRTWAHGAKLTEGHARSRVMTCAQLGYRRPSFRGYSRRLLVLPFGLAVKADSSVSYFRGFLLSEQDPYEYIGILRYIHPTTVGFRIL
jgi:hypothetical protein